MDPIPSTLEFSGEHTIARWLQSQVAVWNPGSFASQLCGPNPHFCIYKTVISMCSDFFGRL